MQSLKRSITAIVDWISIRGRINRKDFWLCYVLPALVLALIQLIVRLPFLTLLALILVASGLVKRSNDIGAALTGWKKAGLLSVWGVLSLLAVAAAIIAFLGGISGLGDRDLLNAAQFLILVPVLPVLLIPLIIGLRPGSPDQNEHGPVPEALSLTKGDFGAVTLVALLISAIGLGIGTLQPREPELIQAIKDQDLRGVEALLRDGADPNLVTQLGTTALMLALEQSERVAMVEPLLEYGADPDVASVLESDARYTRDSFGPEALAQLDRHTPLVYAITNYFGADARVIERLIEYGANVDPAPANDDEPSPLLVAVEMSRRAVVEMLMKHGADVSAPSNQPAFMEALARQDFELVYLLSAGGIDPDQLDYAISATGELVRRDSGSIKLRAIEQLLKETANRQLGEEKYPYRHFFVGEPEQVEALTTFTQQVFQTPIEVTSTHHIPVRKGPGSGYETVNQLYAGQELLATAITDVGSYMVWFRVRDRKGIEGYVSGESLCSRGDWFRGFQYQCGLP